MLAVSSSPPPKHPVRVVREIIEIRVSVISFFVGVFMVFDLMIFVGFCFYLKLFEF